MDRYRAKLAALARRQEHRSAGASTGRNRLLIKEGPGS